MRVILCDNYKCKKAINNNEVISLSVTIDGKTDTYDLCTECYNKFMQDFIVEKEIEEEPVETTTEQIEVEKTEPVVENDTNIKKVRKTYKRKKKTVLATQIDIYGKEKLISEYINNIYTAGELANRLNVSRASLANYFCRNGITKKIKEKPVEPSEKESHT